MRAVAIALSLLILPSLSWADATGGIEIVVVKREGIAAHAEVAEEFADRCRVRAKVVNLDLRYPGQVRDMLHSNYVVLAVGQKALEAVKNSPAHIVTALAQSTPPGVIVSDAVPPPELALRALKAARPTVKRIGVVHGPRTDRLIADMVAAARDLGVTLVVVRAGDGPQAVRELRKIASTIDALWLAPDLDVLTPQLFQYAITLEIQRMIPVVAVTRQQVKSGALLAIDADPHAVGRQAAEIVNRLLAGEDFQKLSASQQTGSVEVSFNGEVARRLGANVDALEKLDAVRVE
jgi:ABC-type uncharacterized transport system substrate-binding protein